MILQALNEYYERKSSDPDDQLAPFGFEWKEMPFIIELSEHGEFIQLEDTREVDGNKKRGKRYLIPKSQIRAGAKAYEKPNLLWDHYGFVLEYAKRGSNSEPSPKDIETARLQHEHFIKRTWAMREAMPNEKGVNAVLEFLEHGDSEKLLQTEQWKDCANIKGCNLSFRIQGRRELVCQSKEVINFVQYNANIDRGEEEKSGICLVTGERSEIERLHPSISGVGAKPAPLAAVNDGSLPSLSSFAKSQGFNFPVIKKVAFAYTTALNHLLRKGSSQRIQVGDTSTVFWTEKDSGLETAIPNIFNEPPKDDPDRNTNAVKALYQSINHGLLSNDEGKTKFYVLGLAPNAARIAIRFFNVATVAELARRIKQHFDDLEIIHSERDLPHLPLFRLLVSVATQGKADNIPPNLGGEVMRSILEGLPYPQTLLAATVRRIKSEQSKKDAKINKSVQNVTYPRAAIIKACLNRVACYTKQDIKEEIKVSLDENNTNPGYLLGRLFSVLEKIQQEAINPKATIRDRYYGTASSTPVMVFSTLMKLKNHHLSKLENRGRATNFEKLLGQIMDGIDDFPANLALDDQGRFAIGYYHQRHALPGYFQRIKTEEKGEE